MARIKEEQCRLKDKTQIILRSPTVDDTQMITYCINVFSNSEYLITEADEYQPDLEKQKKWIESFDKEDSFICIVAEYEGEIIGCIDFKSRISRRRIAHRGDFGMGVIKAWQGKGIGKALLRRLISWASSNDNIVEKIELGVVAENEAAINLYKSFGFKEEGRVSGEVKLRDGRYLDGLIMGLWVNR